MTTSALSPISLTQFFYSSGELVRPARLRFYRPQTLDPIAVYTDPLLGVPHPEELLTGGSGRCPPVYVGPDPYRVRIFDTHGSLIEDIPYLVGAVEPGSPGGGSVLTDDEQKRLIKTGDFVFAFMAGGMRDGFVRANGGLLASPTYSPVGVNIERQDSGTLDCQPLFIHLWGQDSGLVLDVLPTRGSNALDDWNGGKAIALPDLCGRALRGLDDMGFGPALRLAGVAFTEGDSSEPGSAGGASTHTVTLAETPAHQHTVNGSMTGITGTGSVAAQPFTISNASTGITATNTGSAIINITDAGHRHSYKHTNINQLAAPGSGAFTPMAAASDYFEVTADSLSNITAADAGHTHAIYDPQHTHTASQGGPHSHTITDVTHTHTMTTVGGGAAMPTIAPFALCTVYIKL